MKQLFLMIYFMSFSWCCHAIDSYSLYLVRHAEKLTDSKDPAHLRKLVDQGMALLVLGFGKARERAAASNPIYATTGRGDPPIFSFFYDRDGCGSYWIHTPESRRAFLDDPVSLTEKIAHVRKQQWLTHKFFRDFVPGFKNAHLMDIHPHVARSILRSREPGGFTEYDIPWEYIEIGDNRYHDSIARVMGHPNAGQGSRGFQVPYRSLIPRDLEGILITGKPACRFFHYHGTSAALGQAAGAAAHVAASEGVLLRSVDVGKVQDLLSRQEAVVF